MMIVQNLLSNALKFGRSGTAVAVTIKCMPVQSSVTKGRAANFDRDSSTAQKGVGCASGCLP